MWVSKYHKCVPTDDTNSFKSSYSVTDFSQLALDEVLNLTKECQKMWGCGNVEIKCTHKYLEIFYRRQNDFNKSLFKNFNSKVWFKCGYNKLTLIHVFKILFSFEFLSNEIFEINSFENSNFTLFTSTLFAVTHFQFIIINWFTTHYMSVNVLTCRPLFSTNFTLSHLLNFIVWSRILSFRQFINHILHFCSFTLPVISLLYQWSAATVTAGVASS